MQVEVKLSLLAGLAGLCDDSCGDAVSQALSVIHHLRLLLVVALAGTAPSAVAARVVGRLLIDADLMLVILHAGGLPVLTPHILCGLHAVKNCDGLGTHAYS